MKFRFRYLFFSFFIFLLFPNVAFLAESDFWHIKDFHVEIQPYENSHVFNVSEKIDTYFDSTALDAAGEVRRGILRYIPFYYLTEDNSKSYRLVLNNFKITDQNNQDRTFLEELDYELDSYFLRIGDSDVFIGGKNLYNISYDVENAWRSFDDHDELYWNVTGNDWDVPIDSASIEIDLKYLIKDNDWSAFDYNCFTGVYYSRETACTGKIDKINKKILITADEKLGIGENLTVAINIAPGIVPAFDPYDYYQYSDYEESDVWSIDELRLDIKARENSSEFDFNERIKLDINGERSQKSDISVYGIERTLPWLIFSEDSIWQQKIQLSNVNVYDDRKQDRYFIQSYDSSNENYFLDLNDYLNPLIGQQLFDINYKVANLWSYSDSKAKLSWSVKTDYYAVPVEKMEVNIDISNFKNLNDLEEGDVKLSCLILDYDTARADCFADIDLENNMLQLRTDGPVFPGEELVFTLELDDNFIYKLGFLSRVNYFFHDNAAVFLPFFVLFIFFIIWWFRGKDYDLNRPLLVQYKAVDKMSPAPIAELYFLNFKTRYITAEIIYLAVLKYIKIKIKDDVYTLILLKRGYKNDKNLRDYHKVILDKLFSGKSKKVTISSLKYALSSYIQPFKKAILSLLRGNEYLNQDPRQTRRRYITFALILGIISMFYSLGISSSFQMGTVFVVSFVVQIILIILAYLMPKLKLKGEIARWEIQGLYHYLDTAETERFKEGELKNLFEKLLPYAIAFGMIDKWMEIMKELYTKNPDWIDGDFKSFETSYFTDFVSAIKPAYKSRPTVSSGSSSWSSSRSYSRPSTSSYSSSSFSSSSGGFSSGGFGGGGGSSW